MVSAVLVGRFRLVERAGKGASGDVYRAVDEQTGRDVAVKVLSRSQDHDSLERFSREARMLSRIADPHVVRYVADGADEDGRPFVVVDWLEGEDLGARQKRAPLDAPLAREVVRQAALGLGAIHALGIVHRDIKPSNLFLTETPGGGLHVTVIDLGGAHNESETLITREGFMIGTPSYMSPEQVLGRRDVTAQSDIFSLGVVYFELCARARPYRADDVIGLVARIALQDPPRLAAVVPEVPPDLDLTIATAMARDPKDRFPTAADFARAIARSPAWVSPKPAVLPEEEATKTPSSTMATNERRVVTTVMVRLESAEEASHATARVEHAAAQSGGAFHRLLSLAFVIVFGGALSRGSEAQRAARAALALATQLPGARIAVATGRAIGGSMDARVWEGIHRDDGGHGVAIDHATARMLGDAFEIAEDAGRRWLLGERSFVVGAPTFLGRAAPCLGRDRELAQLDALVGETIDDGVARATLVIGDPGAGKTRLFHELRARVAEKHPECRFLLARGRALAEDAALGMLREGIRGYARLAQDEPADAQRAKLTATIREGASAALVPLIIHLASAEEERAEAVVDGALVHDQLRVAFLGWLRSVTQAGPLCLLIDDLHFGDRASVNLLDAALGELSESPIFVAGFARPELDLRFPALFQSRSPMTLRLGKLGRKACVELARSALGALGSPAVVDSMVSRADGNPFYLEELVRAVGASDGSQERLSELPDTVLGMVQARLDSLGPASKRVLKGASVFGEVFWPSGVGWVLEESSPATTQSLMRDLARQEILERRFESRFSNEEEYSFRSGLVRDVANALLTDEDRAAAHGRVAQWLEKHGEHEAIVVARHHEKSGKLERARPHFERAAEKALVGSDFALTIECGDLAIAYGSTGEARGRVLLAVAEARRWRGELPLALEAASFALESLPPGSVAWFAAMRELVAAHGRLGHAHEMRTLAERSLSSNPEIGAGSARIAALVPAAVHLLYAGDVSGAEAIASRIEHLARATDLEPRARARLHQMRAAFAQTGKDQERAMSEQELALESFEAANDRRAAALVRVNLGFALAQVGAYERAEALLRATLVDASKLGLGTIAPLALQNLGDVLARLGRGEEALEVQGRAAKAFAKLKDPRLESSSRVHLAFLFLERGELDRAEGEVRGVLASSFEPLHVGAFALLAKVRLGRGDTQGALFAARRAAEILSRLGAVEEFEGVARVVLVEALLAAGLVGDARAATQGALANIRRRARGFRDPDLQRSFVERIEEHVRLAALEQRLAE